MKMKSGGVEGEREREKKRRIQAAERTKERKTRIEDFNKE